MPSASPLHNQPEFSVSQLSAALKRVVEDNFGYVRVRGEISGFKRAASGHLYFDLKDENAVLNACCWKGSAQKIPFKPEDGLEVICLGKISTYAGRSSYQIIVESMEPAGIGALMALLEKRKEQLLKEGLFDPARKRPLPFLPDVIGVVTSPTGAVIRDILHRLGERFPVHVLLWPVLVQGEGAAVQITAAIEGFNTLSEAGKIPRPDLLIVARGGGSIEDLWPFNEENVVRAAAASAIPLISAVGHETDTTLIDYVSDKRAPTPTAAAEIAVPVRAELKGWLLETARRTYAALHRQLSFHSERLSGLSRALPRPQAVLQQNEQRLDEFDARLKQSLRQNFMVHEQKFLRPAERLSPQGILRMQQQRQQDVFRAGEGLQRGMVRLLSLWGLALEKEARLLGTMSYQNILKRGFVLVRDTLGNAVLTRQEAEKLPGLMLEFQDGKLAAIPANAPKQASLFKE